VITDIGHMLTGTLESGRHIPVGDEASKLRVAVSREELDAVGCHDCDLGEAERWSHRSNYSRRRPKELFRGDRARTNRAEKLAAECSGVLRCRG
jgi:hypothetical protein